MHGFRLASITDLGFRRVRCKEHLIVSVLVVGCHVARQSVCANVLLESPCKTLKENGTTAIGDLVDGVISEAVAIADAHCVN